MPVTRKATPAPGRLSIFMRIAAIILLFVLVLAAVVFGQSKAKATQATKPAAGKSKLANAATSKTAVPKPSPKATPTPEPTPTPVDPNVEKQRWDEALAESSAPAKAVLLKSFVTDFPDSDKLGRARELLVVARAAAGDEMFRTGEREAGIALFREALNDAPVPFPVRLFDEVISKFPASLFFRGEREAAIEAAANIEKSVAGDAGRLTELANFYLSIEDGAEAKRLAESALANEPASAAAYLALGLANRLNFELEAAASAFAKGLEIDPSSATIKRSLADMYRALGKPAEAETLYRELLAASAGDVSAQTGAILALFDRGESAAAEIELTGALETNPKNVILLAGAALWHASNGDPEKAIGYAERAAALEPRYVWSHIALGRARMRQNDPLAAERALLAARRFGNFPMLEYELAEARIKAGFYRAAAEGLTKVFTLSEGKIQTRLGGRILREAGSFAELLSPEARASIFAGLPPESPEMEGRVRALLELAEYTRAGRSDEEQINEKAGAAAEKFVAGNDMMKLHRQLFAASVLLDRSIALEKVLEITADATGKTDTALEVSNPAAAVMASELYETRAIALARDEFVKIPEIPRQTLSAILRGRIEEIAGWALFRMEKYPESLVRLRRAISVLPEKSAWWRSTMWKLGSAYEANGKPEEALDAYVRAYLDAKPNPVNYIMIESLYRKIKGSTDGLESLIGPNPLPPIIAQAEKPTESAAAATAETGAETANPPEGGAAATEKTEEKQADKTGKPTDTEKPQTAEKSENQEQSPPKPAQIPVEETTEPLKSNIESAGQSKNDADTPAEGAKDEKKDAVREKAEDAPVGTKRESESAAEPIKDAGAVKDGVLSVGEKPIAQGVTETKIESIPETPPETIKPPAAAPAAQSSVFDPIIITFGRKPADAAQATVVPPTALPKQGSELAAKSETGEKPPEGEQTKPAIEPADQTAKPVEKTVDNLEKPASEPSVKDDPVTDSTVDVPTAESAIRNPLATDHPKPAIPAPVASIPPEPDNLRAEFEPMPLTGKRETAENEIPALPGEKPASTGDPARDTVVEKKPESTEKLPESDPVAVGAERARIVNSDDPEANPPPPQPCWIFVSKESVTIATSGRDVGLLVGIDGGDAASLKAESTSEEDVEARLTTEVAGVAGRAFLVIRSKSGKPGVFQILLAAPCGRKEITVSVK